MFSKEVWRIISAFVDLKRTGTDITKMIRRRPSRLLSNPKKWCTMVFLPAFCWCIWLETNSRICKEEFGSVQVVGFRIAYSIADWLGASQKVDRDQANC
ncbi:unnamed protein product [Linum trigynum]|uniref:Uncharacterized protein n=1 Tax=Linum trigynum TaxID=586398 RepID=A0AAV2D9N8_9ROSI